jgi:hypothetical protein
VLPGSEQETDSLEPAADVGDGTQVDVPTSMDEVLIQAQTDFAAATALEARRLRVDILVPGLNEQVSSLHLMKPKPVLLPPPHTHTLARTTHTRSLRRTANPQAWGACA